MSITKRNEDLLAAIGAWDPVETHEAAGATVALTRVGRGSPVVCLHATGHGAGDYRDFAVRMAGEHEVFAVDWPGQGRSPRDVEAASAARYSVLLEALLPRLTDRPAIVVGCSIGGAAALALAARRPDLVRALVLCDPGGLVPIDAAVRFFTSRMAAFFRAGARGARWYPRAFALYYAMVLPSPAAREQRRRIVDACRETAPVLAEAWASFGDRGADLRELAPRIRCPSLFAWAKQDRVIPWSRCRAAAERVPDHRIELFDGGHAAFLEQPELFAERFRAFVATLDTGAGNGSRPAAGIGSGKGQALR